MQIIYIIYNLLGGGRIVPPKIKDIKKSRKRSVYGTFGTLRGTRTLDLLVRSQSLYPTELAARISKNIKMLAVCTQIDLAVRSQSLYPAELQAHFSNSFIIISSKVQYVNPFFKKTSNFLRKSYFSQKYLYRYFYCGIVCPKTLFVPFTSTRFHLGGVYYDRSYRI